MKKTVDSLFSTTVSSARTWMAVGAAAILITGISACSDSDDDGAAVSSPVSSEARASSVTEMPGSTQPAGRTETVTVPPPVTIDPTDPGGNPDPDDNSSCDPDNSAAVIEAAIGQIAPPVPGGRWVPAENNFSCSGFTYVALATEGGTVSSPYQLAFFYDGVPVGAGCNLSYQTVTGADDTEVYVTYRYIVGDEPNADPQGQADVSYRWTGSGVERIGALPGALTPNGC